MELWDAVRSQSMRKAKSSSHGLDSGELQKKSIYNEVHSKDHLAVY